MKKPSKQREETCSLLLATRAEQAVIGVLLLAPKAYGKISGVLSSEDFEDARYRRVFDAAKRLHDSGKPVDEVTILGELKLRDDYEDKAVVVLAECAKSVPHTRHLSEYCSMVKEASRKRQLVKECEACVAAIYGGAGFVEGSSSLRELLK